MSDSDVVIFNIPYLCEKTGTGINVQGLATSEQLLFAATLVMDCENTNGPCSEKCELRKLAETDGTLSRYKEMLGG